MSATTPAQPKTSWLDRMIWPALNLDVEKLLYLILIVAAILTRFVALGDRAMSHDESLHTYYSWNLYKGGGFSHTPLMHGPFLFHINALIYSLFGADDFTARISVAVFGVALVALPYFMRRWLGRLGGLVASFMLLISPSIWYHARYIRDEAYMLTWGLIIVWAMFAYWRSREKKWLYLIAGTLAFAYISMESAFIFCIIFGAFASVVDADRIIEAQRFLGGCCRSHRVRFGVAALIAVIVVWSCRRCIMGAIGLGPGDAMPFPQPPQPLQPGLAIEFSAQLTYWIQMLGGTAKILLFTLGARSGHRSGGCIIGSDLSCQRACVKRRALIWRL